MQQRTDAVHSGLQNVKLERERYHSLFEEAPIAYVVTDQFGMIREANFAAAAMLAIRPEFLKGKPLITFVPEEGRPAFRSELSRLADLSRSTYHLRLRPRKQPPFPATAVVSTLRNPTGEAVSLLWSIRDDTPIHRAHESLRNQNVELERRVAERTEQLRAQLRAQEKLVIRAHASLAESGSSVVAQ